MEEGVMTTLTRRSGSTMADMLNWLETGTTPFKTLGLAPAVRVEDFVEDGTYVLRAEMPGIDPDKDIELTVDHDMLTIKGVRREETHDKNHHEFHYGSFSRTVPMPRGIEPDQVTATYTDGVLEVRIPSAAEEIAATRKIPVTRPEASPEATT
jgi:HSP20 family molecular chaperone IbpA